MMKKNILMFLLLIAQMALAQVVSEELSSVKLGGSRKITIVEPENYDKKNKYPLIVVLNAHRLLEPTASSVRYFTKAGEMPASVVVGVYNTNDEVKVSEEIGVPDGQSANFFEFVAQEVIPFVQSRYSTNNFIGVVADGHAANLANFYLLKENSRFNAYLILNPILTENVSNSLPNQLEKFQNTIFYYLAWTENDDNAQVEKVKALHEAIAGKTMSGVIYEHGNFPRVSPIAVSAGGVPEGLNLIFYDYRPISMKDYAEKLLPMESLIAQYMIQKYDNIKSLYDLDKRPLINDVKTIYAAALKRGDYESLKTLAKYIRPSFKKTTLPDFIEGEYYLRIEEPRKALKSFQKSYAQESIDFVTREMVGEKMQSLQGVAGASKKKGKGEEPQETETTEETPQETSTAPQEAP